MYIQVKLLNGYKQELTYKVPEGWDTTELVGSIVQVPVRNTITHGVVTQLLDQIKQSSYTIKEALSIERMPHDTHYHSFINQLSRYYRLDPSFFSRRLKQFLSQKEAKEYVPTHTSIVPLDIELTDEQKVVVDFCLPHITTPTFKPIVVHGVTGSGKTEVYKKLILKAHAEQKSVIFLLPEVTLATTFELLFKQQLPQEIIVYGFHSASSVKDKKLLWQSLLVNKPVVIIGVHLPVLLPIANLGLIIVDEEHEVGFQEKKHPKINSKEAALYRAKIAGIPIILGSATPSVSTLYNVKHKGWDFFQLLKRFAGSFPIIEIAVLNDKKQRKQFWITKQLETAITQQLARKEQTIIFINRRGYSFFVQCKECTHIFQCSNCSVSLTLHEGSQLHCHYCGFCQQQPNACPQCKKTDSFIKKGIGTQQAVEILQKLFPQARIARADMDSTTNKKQWQTTMNDMKEGTIDILVGTQTITKGYHFPRVTLVGILWADLNLNFPIFNAGETTLAQLIQVAGRAGRNSQSSKVIVQTMMDHPIFNYLHEVDYLKFFELELEQRIKVGYPPYKRLVELELKNDDEHMLEQDANKLTDMLIDAAQQLDAGIQVLGPAKPPIYKIKNSHRMKIYIKGSSLSTIFALLDQARSCSLRSSLFFTPNPLSI